MSRCSPWTVRVVAVLAAALVLAVAAPAAATACRSVGDETFILRLVSLDARSDIDPRDEPACGPFHSRAVVPWTTSPCSDIAAHLPGQQGPALPGEPPVQPTLVAAPSLPPTIPIEPYGLRKRGHYFLVSPAGILIQESRPAYMYSLEVGLHVPLRRALALQIGGFFAHALAPDRYTHDILDSHVRTIEHIFAIGPQLRFGFANERVFVYALTRLGIGFGGVQVDEVDGPQPYFRGSVGAGALRWVYRRLLLGGELGFDWGDQSRARGSVIVGVTFW